MAKHPEHEEKNTTPDSTRSSDSRAEGDSTGPSKAALMRLRLKRIASYAMLGFAPGMAVLALVIAISGNQSSQMQLGNASAKVDSLSTSLSESKSEIDKLKAAMAQEKTMHENRVAKIIQDVTQLQVLMQVFPTLEEELHQAASAIPPVANAAAVPAKSRTDRQ